MAGKKKILQNPRLFLSSIDTIDNQFLAGVKCTNCNRLFFPRKRVCNDCLTIDQMEEVPLSSKGELYSYAISWRGPVGFVAPYVIGWVDLPEGVRLFSMITDCEPYEKVLQIGMPVELVMHKIVETVEEEHYTYCFKPAK
jgi:uncharacterized protein